MPGKTPQPAATTRATASGAVQHFYRQADAGPERHTFICDECIATCAGILPERT